MKLLYKFISLIIFLKLVSCNNERSDEHYINPIAFDTPKELNEVETRFAYAKGEEVFKANCITCHSLRYIKMQPDLPKKSWEKIVEKMSKTFGASISDSYQKIIVNYLCTIKGKS